MRITRVLRSDCPSGIDCGRVYDTDGPHLVVQGRTTTTAALGLDDAPAGSAFVLVARHLLSGVASDGGARVDTGPDIAVRGRQVADPEAIGVRTPPPHESLVIVPRADLPGLSAAGSC